MPSFRAHNEYESMEGLSKNDISEIHPASKRSFSASRRNQEESSVIHNDYTRVRTHLLVTDEV